MLLPKRKLGQKGEQLAKKHLQSKGYLFIAANFHTRFGEIDLIFQDGDQLVFVEVKTRSTTDKGLPEEAITPRKISHLKKAIDFFYLENPELPRYARIDAVSITKDHIKHIQNISQ